MPDDFPARKAAAEAQLRAGYDPELENDSPRKSDCYMAAYGWLDALKEAAEDARG